MIMCILSITNNEINWHINVRIDHRFDHRQEFYIKNIAVRKRNKKGKKYISHKNGKIKSGEMAAVNVSKRNFQKRDLKSRDGNIVPVRPRPRAPISSIIKDSQVFIKMT